MKLGPFEMRLLLETAGFRVRGATRADCIRCEGQSRGTVAFTTEVAYCHRCKWTANTLTLARELGLLSGNPGAASAYREEARRRAILESEINRFERGARVKSARSRTNIVCYQEQPSTRRMCSHNSPIASKPGTHWHVSAMRKRGS